MSIESNPAVQSIIDAIISDARVRIEAIIDNEIAIAATEYVMMDEDGSILNGIRNDFVVNISGEGLTRSLEVNLDGAFDTELDADIDIWRTDGVTERIELARILENVKARVSDTALPEAVAAHKSELTAAMKNAVSDELKARMM